MTELLQGMWIVLTLVVVALKVLEWRQNEQLLRVARRMLVEKHAPPPSHARPTRGAATAKSPPRHVRQ